MQRCGGKVPVHTRLQQRPEQTMQLAVQAIGRGGLRLACSQRLEGLFQLFAVASLQRLVGLHIGRQQGRGQRLYTAEVIQHQLTGGGVGEIARVRIGMQQTQLKGLGTQPAHQRQGQALTHFGTGLADLGKRQAGLLSEREHTGPAQVFLWFRQAQARPIGEMRAKVLQAAHLRWVVQLSFNHGFQLLIQPFQLCGRRAEQTPSGNKRRSWRRSAWQISAMPGYCTLSTSPRPSDAVARCTWPRDAAAKGCSSICWKNCPRSAPYTCCRCPRSALKGKAGTRFCSEASALATGSGNTPCHCEAICPSFSTGPFISPRTSVSRSHTGCQSISLRPGRNRCPNTLPPIRVAVPAKVRKRPSAEADDGAAGGLAMQQYSSRRSTIMHLPLTGSKH